MLTGTKTFRSNYILVKRGLLLKGPQLKGDKMIGLISLIFSIVFVFVNKGNMNAFEIGAMILISLFITELDYFSYKVSEHENRQESN